MSRSKRAPLTAQDRAQWRDKVREECLQRAKEHRQSMLWRMRQVVYPHSVYLVTFHPECEDSCNGGGWHARCQKEHCQNMLYCMHR